MNKCECKPFGVRVERQECGKCGCDSGKKVGCLPAGGIKKHTPGLGASLQPPLRCICSQAPALRVLHFVAQPVMVFPRLWSQPSGPVFSHGPALFRSLRSIPFRSLLSFPDVHFVHIISFVRSLHFISSPDHSVGHGHACRASS